MAGLLRRRDVLAGGVAAAAMGLDGRYRPARAQGAATITGVTWGGPWVDAWKQLAAKQSAVDVHWVLHESATTAILAKIRAAWPNPSFDFVNATPTTLIPMMREGWLEPLTPAAIPNLAHVPPAMCIKNDAGDIFAVAMNVSGVFWGYDQHAADMTVEKPDDLLSPKLRGKVLLNAPTILGAAQLVSLALARGGGYRNTDPGFEFIKDIIKAKNVGAVVKTDVECVNAFTTGAVAIGIMNTGNYHEIRKHVTLSLLNKVPDSPMFKTFTGFEGVCVLKRDGNRKPVMDFLNYALEAGNDSNYSAVIGSIPSNDMGTATPELQVIQLHSAEEIKKFAIIPDYAYASTQTDAWNRKWELEIAPLL
jgi:putative spermidine/putrescine transport system substrate-binding protein